MEVRACLGAVLMAAAAAGCQSPQLLTPGPASVTSLIQYQLLEPAPRQVEVRIDQVCRGPRGGVLQLSLRNVSADSALLLDWSKAGIRLGGGQYRKCIDRERFVSLCEEFGAAAYGFAGAAGQPADTNSWPLITADAIYRLKPGEEVGFAVPFGAPQEESMLTLSLDAQALYTEGQGSDLSLHPLRLRVELPNISPAQTPPWWPEWLHFSVVATNGG